MAVRHPAVLRDAKSPEEVGRERGGWWEVPGRWELVQSSPGCIAHIIRLRLGDVAALKEKNMMGKGRRMTPIAKSRRDKHHSSWKGVKDLAGKISHLKRENSIRGKKSPGPGSVIRPHEKFLLGSNLCPLCPGLLIWSEAAGYMSLC